MSFQAYLDDIEVKIGMRVDDFRRCAETKGFADRGKGDLRTCRCRAELGTARRAVDGLIPHRRRM
jgi:hypothetical protein